MQKDFVERRRHIRVYFDNSDTLECEFSHGTDAVEVSTASVLDISMGGLHLAADRARYAVGERITVSRMVHRTGPVSEETIPVEIRWVFAPDGGDRVYMGGRFLELPEESRRRIANLISVTLLKAASARPGGSQREGRHGA